MDRHEHRPDVIVIGGGIVGTSAAAFLAEAGARVVLVEREGIASGASGANSGVVQHPFDPVLVDLYHATVGRYRRLSAASTGFRLADRPAGMLFVAETEAPARAVAEETAATFPHLSTAVVGGLELERLDPALRPGLWGCHVDIGYPVMPGASTYAYATLAEDRGAHIRAGRSATLAFDGDRVTGVVVDGRPIDAGSVLVAAGPWTPALIDPTGRWRPIEPRWGVVVEAELASPPIHVLEEAGIETAIGVSAGDAHPAQAFSLVPLPGASAVGSTFLPTEPEPSAWIEPILLAASRFVPAVAEAPIRGSRACARPQSIDGRPLVGAVPGLRDLFVCAGHGPWGISTGPGSAALVVDLMLGRHPTIDAALDPVRFGDPTAPPARR